MTLSASKVYTQAELCQMEQVPEPCALVIFGASGDLTARKLLPSLASLQAQGLLPKGSYVVGTARSPLSDDAFRAKAPPELRDRSYYLAGDSADPAHYGALKKTLDELDARHGVKGRRLFYLSTVPSLYSVIARGLGAAGLAAACEGGWTRLVVEKPFGTDLASAVSLNAELHSVFGEEQLYRIDHYLGKETVQNILVFRFGNALFERAWGRDTIDHVQITAAETLGVEGRAGYYEQAGVLRDMFQNHLLQLLALIAMEPPTRFTADAVRDEKRDTFNSISVPKAGAAVLGQYAGYRAEPGVSPASATPTFAALRLEVDDWRWQGVPFYLRSGKRLPQRVTEVAVHFKRVPTSIFRPLMSDDLAPNVLRFRIQPDEGLSLCFEAKHPGPKLCLSSVTMDFNYQKTFGTPPPESYARLLLDAMTGDQTLFARHDEVEQCWRIIEPLLQGTPVPYAAGSWGPEEAQALLAREGRAWDLA